MNTEKKSLPYELFPHLKIKDLKGNIYRAIRLDYIKRDWLVYVVPDMKKLLNAILLTTDPPEKSYIPVEVKKVIAKEPHHLKLFMGLLNLKTNLAILKGLKPKFFRPYQLEDR